MSRHAGSSSTARAADTASSTSSGDALEVRQRAFDLLNRMGPATDDDESNWPRSPRISSYQNPDYQYQDASPAYEVDDDDDDDDHLGAWGVQGLVQCVSDACKLGASEILSQNAAFAHSGYQTLKSVIVAEAQDRVPSTVDRPRGSFESVSIGDYRHGNRR